MRIQHNIMAMNAFRNYNNNTSALSKNLEKLSSGYKINRAGDDAAGLAISEKMRAQITGLDAAQKNVKDGISLVKTAEGAMQEIHDMLNRMDYLATQSANGTYDNEVDRANLQKEVESLKSEINRIADSSNFNGIKLLDGSLAGESQVKNVAMDQTIAVKGKYTTVATAATGEMKTITTDDIGKTLDYTVAWKDASGNEKTTTVSLTFQGDGTGAVADTNDNAKIVENYFTDANGNKYNMNADGQLSQDNVGAAILAGLKSDKEFASNFDVVLNGDKKFEFTAKADGSAGAVVIGTDVSETTSLAKTAGLVASMSGDATETKEPLDSMQKFNVGNLPVADKSLTKEKIEAKIFEIDGHKFLIHKDLTNEQIKALDDDITLIKVAGTTVAADTETEAVAAEISRVTGLATKGYKTDHANTADNGIVAGDIVFTKDKLNLSGETMTLQIGDTSDDYNQMNVKIGDMHTVALGIGDLDIGNLEDAQAAIDKIRAAINNVSSVRGDLGAIQNRLEHTQNNLSVMEENIQDAESTIRDTDIADEMTAYTKNNILLQSAQAMLAQANQVPQGVLQLLQ